MTRTVLSVTEVPPEALDDVTPPGLHQDFHALGFRPVGRICSDVTPDTPTTVLTASDGSAFVVVGRLTGLPSVNITTALSTGAVVETRMVFDHEPAAPWRKLERVNRYCDPLREQTLSDTPGSGRSIELAYGNASQLWAAHREHVRRWTVKNGGGATAHGEVRQLVRLLNLLFAHDRRVMNRLRNLSRALPLVCFLVLLPIDMALTPTSLGWLAPGALVAWLVVSVTLVRDMHRWTTKLRYAQWIRPSFM